jgi:hypothetical protein
MHSELGYTTSRLVLLKAGLLKKHEYPLFLRNNTNSVETPPNNNDPALVEDTAREGRHHCKTNINVKSSVQLNICYQPVPWRTSCSSSVYMEHHDKQFGYSHCVGRLDRIFKKESNCLVCHFVSRLWDR